MTSQHDPSPRHQRQAQPSPMRFWPVLIIFLALVVFLLWEEHQAHILGALPWLLILVLCPLMHVFMHGDHGNHHRQDGEN